MKALFRIWVVVLLALLVTPAAANAQFTFITNNGAITITGYTGPGGYVTIPSTTNGFPVTTIGDHAFYNCTNLISVTIPNGVTTIGNAAFFYCTKLTNVTIPDSVTSIVDAAFSCTSLTSVTIPNGVTSIDAAVFGRCTSLTNVTIPNSVTFIDSQAFDGCTSLASVTIPSSVTEIDDFAFSGCTSLTSVTIPNSVTFLDGLAFHGCTSLTTAYFSGNAPQYGNKFGVFDGKSGTVYYLPGTKGWGSTFYGWPTALWYQPKPMILGCGYDMGATINGFGFTISWATNIPVVVEACTNLVNPAWIPVATNPLVAGTNHFSDSQWTNFPNRFYRIHSP